MKIGDKLKAVDSFTVTMHDNGFLFSVSGRDFTDEWGEANILCTDTGDVANLVAEFVGLPRSV